MTDTEYIETLRKALADMNSITTEGSMVTYIAEPVLPRTFELKFSDTDLEGYCSFTVSLRNIVHRHTIKVIAHTYDGTKIETRIFKDRTIDEAISDIDSMAVGLYEKTMETRRLAAKFRQDAIDGFTGLGYSTQCNSRYMVGFSSKKKSILVTITASGTFTAELKFIHAHAASGERKLYRTGGPIGPDTGKALVDAFGAI